MLQGDALSIQLFIGATAINALSVAMTKAGWTNRWFVRGMFVLAALLFGATVGWPYIDRRIPLLNEVLQTVVASRSAWFLIGIVPALVGGMFLSDSLRQRRKTRGQPKEWKSVFSAMETLARQDLIERFQHVKQQVFENARIALDLERRISTLHAAAPAVEESQREEVIHEIVKLDEEYRAMCAQSPGLVDTEADCQEALRANIHAQLLSGQLVAKGFLAPHVAGASKIIIPTEEWQFLLLDDAGDQALGPNFEYIAVQIGMPAR